MTSARGRWRELCCALALAFSAPGAAQEVLEGQALDCVITPNATVEVGSSEEGVLDEVLVARGDVVARGAPLARLNAELETLKAELTGLRAQADVDIRSREAQLEFRHRESERVRELKAKNAVPTSDVDKAEVEAKLALLAVEAAKTELRMARVENRQAEALLNRRVITSPVDGIVVEVTLSPGEYVHKQAPLMTIASVHPLHVEVFVPVAFYGQVVAGMRATVLPQQPIGGEHEAEVMVVDQVFDSASRTFGVRLLLPNEAHRLPAGLRCTVRFLPEG